MLEFDLQRGREVLPGPAPSTAQRAAASERVATAARGVAALPNDGRELQAFLEQIASLVTAAVPGATGGAAVLLRAGTDLSAFVARAVTNRIVRDVDSLQHDVYHEGPGPAALRTGRGLVSGSLGDDPRWPRFGSRAARLQIHSALSVPLVRKEAVVGAISLFGDASDAFTQSSLRAMDQLAYPASVAVGNAQLLHSARFQVAQLQSALENRSTIDQAIGVVRSRTGGTAADAIQFLRETGAAANEELVVVAARVVEEAVRRAPRRQGQPDPG